MNPPTIGNYITPIFESRLRDNPGWYRRNSQPTDVELKFVPARLVHEQPAIHRVEAQTEYTREMIKHLEETHKLLRNQQMAVRQGDSVDVRQKTNSEDPPLLFQFGNLVLMQNVRQKKGETLKLQPKFAGAYKVLKTFSNHTYLLNRLGQSTIQNKCRLELYKPCEECQDRLSVC